MAFGKFLTRPTRRWRERRGRRHLRDEKWIEIDRAAQARAREWTKRKMSGLP
jgi:hypothetical protein